MHYRDESEADELRSQIAHDRRNARRKALDPRDPDYYGDPEDFPQPSEDNEQ